jgi:hypothetical protein
VAGRLRRGDGPLVLVDPADVVRVKSAVDGMTAGGVLQATPSHYGEPNCASLRIHESGELISVNISL